MGSIARVHDVGGPFVRNNRMGWRTGVLSALGGGRWTARGGNWSELVLAKGWLRLGCGLAGLQACRAVSKEAVRLTCCLSGGDDEDGPCWRGKRGEKDGGITTEEASTKLSRRDGSTLMKATISLPLSFFVGGQVVAA